MKFIALTVLIFTTSPAFGGIAPVKAKVQGAMVSYVNEVIQQNGFFPIAYQGEILKLKLHKTEKYPNAFHAGVQIKGNLYASCADFIDSKGNKYDVDFIVSKTKNGFRVVQPLVHSINGKKNKYDLDH
jgi:hypothetical protein